MSITRLSQADITSSGAIPFGDTGSGADRRTSVSQLAEIIQGLLTTSGSFLTQYSAPSATGFSVTINPLIDGQSVHLLLTPVAGYAAGTVVLPAVAECTDGQEVLFNTTQAITTLTVSGNGATVTGAPTTAAANAFFRLKFDAVFSAWYRVG